MEKVLEVWKEVHETDEEVFSGEGHYIEHTIYIATNGDIIHKRKVFKFDEWEQEYELSDTIEVILQKKGSK